MIGVYLHPLRQIMVPKGDVWHAFKCNDEGFVGFGEAYFTQIKHGQVKGWKRHNNYTLNIVVVQGVIKFVLYDDRLDSDSYGQFEEIILSPMNNYYRLTIEPGIWMAFQGISIGTSMLIDLIPELHNPNESETKELNEISYMF